VQLDALVDWIERDCSLIACLAACDAVHTMTSQAGFEALLRQREVVVYGRPFYAGWGLTDDRVVTPRRQRTLSLTQLVAATLILYPYYWDWQLNGFTSAQGVVLSLARLRQQRVLRQGNGPQMAPGFRLYQRLVTLWRGAIDWFRY
jgi:capsular polysaccharide export protein